MLLGEEMTAWFEDLPLDFTKEEPRALERLLATAFPTNDALLMFAEGIGLNVAALNAGSTPAKLIRDIVSKARLSDRLAQLIGEIFKDPNLDGLHPKLLTLVKGHEGELAGAMLRRKPSITTLMALPPRVEVWSAADAVGAALSSPGLEQIVNNAAGFADPALFRRGLSEAEVRTARIDIGGHPKASGFLVADAFLLTNWHVVKGGVEGAVAVFDHQLSAPNVVAAGRSIKFAADWLVAKSAHAPVVSELGPDGPPVGDWDFALVRLAEPVGAQAIGPDPKAKEGEKRGRYRLDGSTYAFDEGEPLLILGHPSGRPVQFSYASPSSAKQTKHANRVRYGTNTEGGSSGSPVFNGSWRVVALHHAAGPTKVPGEFNRPTKDFNQGIPIRGIVAELKKQLAGKPELAALDLG